MVSNDNVYRFTLQFGTKSEENIRAGNFLNRLKNKKSAVIVAAINEYLDNHPDAEDAHEITTSSTISEAALKKLIEEVVNSKLENLTVAPREGEKPINAEEISDDITAMLDNVGLFE